MKKIIPLALTMIMSLSAMAQDAVRLPEPDKTVSMTLFDALQNRHSVREFTAQDISDDTLSRLLWAATGVNRGDGRMTAPTAVNAQDISVYVASKQGVSLYRPQDHSLLRVTDQDIRKEVAARQVGVAGAPIFLIIVSDASKFGGASSENGKAFSREDAAYVSQNINLAAAALGLGTVPRHIMNREAISKALHLGQDHIIVLNHPIGYPKK